MTKTHQIGGVEVPYLASYNGGTSAHPSGGTVAVTVPALSQSAIMRAEGGAAYYMINGTATGTASPGYIPDGAVEVIFPIDNFNSLSVSGAATSVHIQFYTA